MIILKKIPLNTLKNSPERLCKIKGIGKKLVKTVEKDIKNILSLKSFKKIDKIASNLELKEAVEKRIKGATQFILNNTAILNGHSCVPKESLCLVASSFLKEDKKVVLETIDKLIEKKSFLKKQQTKKLTF